MWEYHIHSGTLLHNGEFVGTGYSGLAGPWRNNPHNVQARQKGPIPPGRWRIAKARTSERLGPCVMDLDPLAGTATFGRSLFRIHGDNARHDASHGCIILGPAIRHDIAAHVMRGDDELTVLP